MIRIEARPSRLSLASLARCYRTRLTADKREINDFPKLSSATSFMLGTSSEISSCFSFFRGPRRKIIAMYFF